MKWHYDLRHIKKDDKMRFNHPFTTKENNMRRCQFIQLLLALFIFFSSSSFTAEFFVSNNTGEIDLQTAFNRLSGDEQQALQNDVIHIMQKGHVEQGRFEKLLGTYQMSKDQNITADNTEIFITSSYQPLSAEKIFNLAKQLDVRLSQESVAVFIPSKKPIIGDVTLTFQSHDYSIHEIIEIIHKNLPMQYGQAFSLYLNNTCSGFDKATVKKVEWLGGKIKPNEIQNKFPHEKISYHYGKAYLVYKNGRVENL